MPRPREFDEDEVLQRATEAFWSRGYEATSITDLMEATGLAKGSIYKGFGDKHAFFLRTLDAYLESGVTRFVELAASSPSPEATLRGWLHYIVETATCKGERRGCYAVNCVTELAPHDPEVQARLRAHYRRFEQLFVGVIERGTAAGAFHRELSPRVAARNLMIFINGLQVYGKTGMTRREAMAAVDMVFESLIPGQAG